MKYPLFLSALFLFASCKQEPPVSATPDTESATCCEGEEAPGALEAVEGSIYQLESKWTDDQGKVIPLASLAGNIRVVCMGYTTCQYACPRLLADLRAIEGKLSPELLDKTRFTFISIDPEADTPARLAEYRKESQIDPEHWTLLTGDADAVQELAVVLGIQYRKTGEADFAHSNVITVLDSQGVILHRQEGLSADPTETLKAIAAAR
ncbi:MAG: SCO family protein [Verrucomicrobiaceae bacterium]